MRVSVSLMLAAVLVVVLAAALAAFTYLRLERLGTRGWIPMVCRAVAWAALGLLILNVSCPAPSATRTALVLLDGSLSMGAPGARGGVARDSAFRWGEVRVFGDERGGTDSAAIRGRSLLGPALAAAAASDRPVVVVTDGEIEDAADLAPEVLARAAIRVFPREVRPDRAITSVTGPARVTAGDSIPLEVEVQAAGDSAPEAVRVEVLAGSRRIGARTIPLVRGIGRARIQVPSSSVGAGEHLLQVTLAGDRDAEPRTDSRLHLVTVAATPGVVLLSDPGDWDGRFLYRALRDVAQLPVRGFVRIEGGQWRSMADLRPVPGQQVRQAARRADLLIAKGAAEAVQETGARGVWSWPGPAAGRASIDGEWYLSAEEVSPLAGAFLGQPVDSFPPVSRLVPHRPEPGEWTALTALLNRRGAARPAVVGRDDGRVRRVTVLADGLWRWAFRGGSSEQTYRSWVAATASWLLGGADSARGAARPVRAVVANGRPLVFEWLGSGAPRPLPVAWTGTGAPAGDTLRFDGAGRATVWLPPGEYRYRLAGGGDGVVAVERYSDELLPRAVTLASREARTARSAGRTAARDWLWLFAVCVLGLAAEWLARRRLGLR